MISLSLFCSLLEYCRAAVAAHKRAYGGHRGRRVRRRRRLLAWTSGCRCLLLGLAYGGEATVAGHNAAGELHHGRLLLRVLLEAHLLAVLLNLALQHLHLELLLVELLAQLGLGLVRVRTYARMVDQRGRRRTQRRLLVNHLLLAHTHKYKQKCNNLYQMRNKIKSKRERERESKWHTVSPSDY